MSKTGEEFVLPIAIKSELSRLASVLQLDDQDMDSEQEVAEAIAQSIRVVQRIQYEGMQAAKQSEYDPDEDDAAMAKRELKIKNKAKSLEDDLRISLKSIDDAHSLKAKIAKLTDKIRKEKSQRDVLEKFIESQNKKIKILISHIEKLMKTLNIETTKTMKAREDNRERQKQEAVLHKRIERQDRLLATQNRHIAEIAEGSRILQDQLSLMDEKYLELRNRLDTARTQFGTQMAKISKTNADLRTKFSAMTGGKLLDTIDLEHTRSFESAMSNGKMRAASASSSRPRTAGGRGAKGHNSNMMMMEAAPFNTVSSEFQQASQNPSWTPIDGKKALAESLLQDMDDSDKLPSGGKLNHPFKAKAGTFFIEGLTHNAKFNNTNKHPDKDASEKRIMKKIHGKQKKSETEGWSQEMLNELINTS